MHVVCIIILEYTTRQRNCNGSPALEKNTIQFLVSTMQLMEAALLKAWPDAEQTTKLKVGLCSVSLLLLLLFKSGGDPV